MATTTILDMHFNPDAIDEAQELLKDGVYREWRAGDGAIPELPALLAGAPSLSICEPRSDI